MFVINGDLLTDVSCITGVLKYLPADFYSKSCLMLKIFVNICTKKVFTVVNFKFLFCNILSIDIKLWNGIWEVFIRKSFLLIFYYGRDNHNIVLITLIFLSASYCFLEGPMKGYLGLRGEREGYKLKLRIFRALAARGGGNFRKSQKSRFDLNLE